MQSLALKLQSTPSRRAVFTKGYIALLGLCDLEGSKYVNSDLVREMTKVVSVQNLTARLLPLPPFRQTDL